MATTKPLWDIVAISVPLPVMNRIAIPCGPTFGELSGTSLSGTPSEKYGHRYSALLKMSGTRYGGYLARRNKHAFTNDALRVNEALSRFCAGGLAHHVGNLPRKIRDISPGHCAGGAN